VMFIHVQVAAGLDGQVEQTVCPQRWS
jgi:hypothetical protein